MAKAKPNQGFIKEIGKTPKAETKKPFDYKRPINKVDNPNNMAINSRSRAYRSVPQDKTTNFKTEQVNAKASHKGSK
jgi:hypothetical protein